MGYHPISDHLSPNKGETYKYTDILTDASIEKIYNSFEGDEKESHNKLNSKDKSAPKNFNKPESGETEKNVGTKKDERCPEINCRETKYNCDNNDKTHTVA